MKKIRARIGILSGLFLTAFLIWFWSSSGQNREDSAIAYASMEEPSLPVIWMQSCGKRINLMRGYVEATDADVAADTLTILPPDRMLPITIQNDRARLLGLHYEIRSADLSNLIERTEVALPAEKEGALSVTLPIQNLVQPGKEYRLDLMLDTAEKGTVHYYSRLGFDETGLAPDMLQLAEDFSERNFDYDRARENTTYLETSAYGDHTDLGVVTLQSDFNQLTYGDLKLKPTGASDLRLLEYSGGVGILRRELCASGDGRDGEQIQVEISESFVMRKGPERIYLMDYVRSMHEIFLGDQNAFTEGKVCLGISEKDSIQSLSSANGAFRAFVSAGDVWLLDGKKSKSVRVWSFRSGTDSGLRGGYCKHRAKILGLDDNGVLDFAVGGYMNRGSEEGRVGVALFQYDRAGNTVTERAFVPSLERSEEVEADLETLAYQNGEGIFYFKAGDAVYALDTLSDEYITVCDSLGKGSFAISEKQSALAWQSEEGHFGAETVCLMNLESGEKKGLHAQEGQLLRPIGFVGNDLAIGIAERGNVWELNGIERELPFTAIEILDQMLNSQTHYEEAGVLLSDARAEQGRIHLTKLRKTGEKQFQVIGPDTIVCRAEGREREGLSEESTPLRKKTFFATLPKDFSGSAMQVQIPQAIHFDQAAEVKLPQDAAAPALFGVYGGGHYLGSFAGMGDALNAAYRSMGFVRSGGALRYCRAGTSAVRTLRNTEGRAKELMEKRLAGGPGDLYGAAFRAVLYFVSRGKPVLGWSDGGTPLLIYAYDQQTVSLYSPSDGQYLKYGMKEAEQMFQNGRNDFYCDLDD